jgi:hypothetical protein
LFERGKELKEGSQPLLDTRYLKGVAAERGVSPSIYLPFSSLKWNRFILKDWLERGKG